MLYFPLVSNLFYIFKKKDNMEWYLKALRQYADFEGRARRKEYWMFALSMR